MFFLHSFLQISGRLFKFGPSQEVDEKDGKVSQNIQRYYGLSPSLCQQYAAIIYILDNRIDVAPRKWVTFRFLSSRSIVIAPHYDQVYCDTDDPKSFQLG